MPQIPITMPKAEMDRVSRRRPQRTFALIAVAVAVTACLASGCSGHNQAQPQDDGPLATTLKGGGNSLDPPSGGSRLWHATFGSLTVCADEKVTLTSVVPHYKVGKPVAIQFYVRRVPPASDRSGPPEAWAPVMGRAAPLNQLVQRDVRSSHMEPLDRTTIDQPCSTDVNASYTEVLTTMAVDRKGVWIDRLDVKYQAGTRNYTLPVDWSYVGCGSDITDTKVCAR